MRLFFLLQRSGIRVFQPTCSFYVYKQKIEIKISNEKNSEGGNPAPVQLPAYRNKSADHVLKAEVKSMTISQLHKLKRVSVQFEDRFHNKVMSYNHRFAYAVLLTSLGVFIIIQLH